MSASSILRARTAVRSPAHGADRGENAFLIARRSVVFSQLSIKRRSRHYVRCFSKICSLGPWRRRKKREGCGTGKGHSGWCSMWMAQGKRLANVPCLVRLIFHPHNADWMRVCADIAPQGVSEGKLSGRGPLCSRLTRTNGSARFPERQVQATATIGESCDRR